MTDLGRYQWLAESLTANDGHPVMVAEALKEFGVHELAGGADNAEILGWAKEVGLGQTYVHDVEPWCGLFMTVIAHRSGYIPPRAPLWAANWRQFGTPSPAAALGDVLVFVRKDASGHPIGGHVALYVGADDTAFHCLGGNQGDQVSIVREAKGRLLTARRPPYKVGPPANVKPIRLQTLGQPLNVKDA